MMDTGEFETATAKAIRLYQQLLAFHQIGDGGGECGMSF